MVIRLKLEGANTLARTLTTAARDLDTLTDAHRAAAPLAQRAAVVAAPFRTGRLRASIRSSVERDGLTISSSLIYARPINYGWRAHNITPHPFITQAVPAAQPVWLKAYEHAVTNALGKVHGT